MAQMTQYDVEIIADDIFNDGLNYYQNPENWESPYTPEDMKLKGTEEYIRKRLWECDIYTFGNSIKNELVLRLKKVGII